MTNPGSPSKFVYKPSVIIAFILFGINALRLNEYLGNISYRKMTI